MTPTQCKMARTALGWTVVNLADKAQVNKNTVLQFEKGGDVYASTIEKLKNAILETGKIRFEGDCCVCVNEK